MTTNFSWHEFMCLGAQKCSPDFDSPEEAGVWRREHPPLMFSSGPTLWKTVDGERVGLDLGELGRCHFEFATSEAAA